MKLSIIGTGYVGLVSGACFSSLGFKITCLDVNHQKIENLKKGIIPIYEGKLEELIEKHQSNLTFTTSYKEGLSNADIIMIAVGTPSRPGDNHADLSYVFEAAKQIAQTLQHYAVIVTKSTVPVGTSHAIAQIIEQTNPSLKVGRDFDVASNPEFLREGSAIDDFMNPDRIVIGTQNPKAEEYLRSLYKPLTDQGFTLYATSIESSEMIKYAANAFLATKIAFVNQIANLCEAVGADIEDVSQGIGSDHRIGFPFLKAGPGYGGSCFPKDTRALIKTAHDNKMSLSIVESASSSNEERKKQLAERIIAYCNDHGVNVKSYGRNPEDVMSMGAKPFRLAILGIVFKAGTDDIRDASSLVIIPELLKAGLEVVVYDPLYFKGSGRETLVQELKGVEWAESAVKAIKDADGLCILTEWDEFKTLNLDHIQMKGRLFVDYRNLFKPEQMTKFDYLSLGRRDALSDETASILKLAS